MSELSPRARGLLGRVSSVDGPSATDRERVLAGLAAVLPQAATGATATTAVSAAGSAGAKAAIAGAGTATKIAVLVVSVAIGGGLTTAGIAAHRWSNTPVNAARVVTATRAVPSPKRAPIAEPIAPASSAPVALVPAPRAMTPTRQPAVPGHPTLEAPASEEQVTAPVDVATEHVAAPPAPVEIARVEPQDPCDLELSTLQRAQQLLSTDPLRAVHELDAIEHTCPAGPLAQERLATRALALCQGGDRSGGRVAAETLAARYPSSPSRARVDQVCGLPSP